MCPTPRLASLFKENQGEGTQMSCHFTHRDPPARTGDLCGGVADRIALAGSARLDSRDGRAPADEELSGKDG